MRANLQAVADLVRHQAFARLPPTRLLALTWHKRMMHGLDTEEPIFAGAFRGEASLEDIGIEIAGIDGTDPSLVDEHQVAADLH